MEFKSINSLSISECCEYLGINKQDLPSIVEQINIDGADQIKSLLLERLKTLLERDKKSFQNCTTVDAYMRYLSVWADGLWREQAHKAVNRLKAEAEELECYNKNRASILGCKTYLGKYPNGRFATEIKNTLNKKVRKRRIRNIWVVVTIISIVGIFCFGNYEPVSYLNLTGNVEFAKIGGETQITYHTDATSNNINIEQSDDWFTLEDNGHGKLTITVSKNYKDQRNGSITVKAYSSFFGKQYNRILKLIKISQESGLPTYLNVNTSNISFDKFGSCKTVSNFDVKTDGNELVIEPNADWFTISKDINDNIETMSASVNVEGQINNEGEKSNYITIRSGNITKRVHIYQESGLATYFRVEKSTLVMAEEGTKEGYVYPINVQTDGTSWSVKEAPYWLKAYADLSQDRLEVEVDKNTGTKKKGSIILISNNGDIHEISVTQKGDPDNFDASKSSIRFGTSNDYEYVSIDNNSDKSLSVGDSESWLSCSVMNKNKIKISCKSNNSSPRSGNVFVSCGNESLTITIKQDGWADCQYCGGDGEVNCTNYKAQWMYYPATGANLHQTWECTGEYYNELFNTWTPSYGWVNCSKCGGSGRQVCPKCDGDGRIKKSY